MKKKVISLSLLVIIVIMGILFIAEIISATGLFTKHTPSIFNLMSGNSFLKSTSFALFLFAALFFYFAIKSKKSRIVVFNIGFLFFILAVAELFLILRKQPSNWYQVEKIDNPAFWVKSDTLGYGVTKNFVNHTIARYGDTVLYDVTYSTDENGLRKTPPIIPNDSTKGLVFFGCSFTFGNGLNDNEVMPNIVQKAVDSKFKVYNFGLLGYGTHQMLAVIENNMIEDIVKYPPKIFIYTALDGHLDRILHYNSWGDHDPDYKYNEKTREIVFRGLWDNKNNSVANHLLNIIADSEIVNSLKKKTSDTSDVKIFIAMVRKSRDLLLKKYPDSEFHIIMWDFNTAICNKMIEDLSKEKFNVHKISEMVPKSDNPKEYTIYYPYELHPNYKVNRLIAEYIVKKILNMTDALVDGTGSDKELSRDH